MNADDWKRLKAVELTNIGLAPTTTRHNLWALDKWRLFCANDGIHSLRDFDDKCAVAWIDWIRGQDYSAASIRSLCVPPLRCIEALAQMDAKAVHASFVFPSARLPKAKATYRKSALSEARLSQIKAACLADIGAIQRVDCVLDLTPFVVLFCIRTGMNAESVLELSGDCVVALPGQRGKWVQWNKGRSGGALQDYYEPDVWGPLEIVEFVRGLDATPLLERRDGLEGQTSAGMVCKPQPSPVHARTNPSGYGNPAVPAHPRSFEGAGIPPESLDTAPQLSG